MDEAERCSPVAYIYFRRLIADGTPDSLRELPDVQPQAPSALKSTTPEVTRALRLTRQLPAFAVPRSSASPFTRSSKIISPQRSSRATP